MISKFKPAVLVVILILVSVTPASAKPSSKVIVLEPSNYQNTPVGFGVRDLNAIIIKTENYPKEIKIYVAASSHSAGEAVKVAMAYLPDKPESFVITRSGDNIAIVGADEVGAMYGCLELTERLQMRGKSALEIEGPIVQSPKISFRSINPFITLPYRESYHEWYFLQDDYWEGYLDLLARSRINWIDLHGMYNIKSTGFPNIYPYFLTSDKFPEAGAHPVKSQRNLAMLKKIMRMAHERGIKVALMSYSAGWNNVGLRESPYEETDENLMAYTRELVRKMIDECPDLNMIGFRIGESGKPSDFYKGSYIPAIKDASRTIDLYTRTWYAKKEDILAIGDEFPGRWFIQIKYNGEQLGPPYIMAGGRTLKWHDYFYQNYHSYPKNYKIIYQLRANGTLRVFPWGNPELAARYNQGSLLGEDAIGISVEPIDAYYPKYDNRHKDDSPNRWYDWQWERDWFWYNVWGRTAYDPSLGKRDDIWVNMFEQRFGEAGYDLYQAMKAASNIIPDAFTAHAFGADHRDHAPELEWGDNVKSWSKVEPFDTANIQTPREWAHRLINKDYSARATPFDVASWLNESIKTTQKHLNYAKAKMKRPTPEFNDLMTELTMLSHLGDYYSHKFMAAAFYAMMQAAMDVEDRDCCGPARIREELEFAHVAWNKLADLGDKHYKPFIDTLRMHTEEFTWSKEGEKNLYIDFAVLENTVKGIKESGKSGTAPCLLPSGDATGPEVVSVRSSISELKADKKMLHVTALIKDPAGVDNVYLKVKPMPSTIDWKLVPMRKQADVFVGEAEITSDGLLWGMEMLDVDGNGTLWPNFRKRMPYKVVLPWNPAEKENQVKGDPNS